MWKNVCDYPYIALKKGSEMNFDLLSRQNSLEFNICNMIIFWRKIDFWPYPLAPKFTQGPSVVWLDIKV